MECGIVKKMIANNNNDIFNVPVLITSRFENIIIIKIIKRNKEYTSSAFCPKYRKNCRIKTSAPLRIWNYDPIN